MFLDVPADYTATQIIAQPFDHHVVIAKSKNLVDYTSTSIQISSADWGDTTNAKKRFIPAPYALKKGMSKLSSRAISKALK